MIDIALCMENTEVRLINEWLCREYLTIDRKPLYRLIWSDKLFENRFGTYRDFTEGGLFIREVTETRKVKKYSYIRERWIFEKWAPGNLTANRETPDAINGDFIPVYVFEDKNGNFLPPNRKVIQFLINYMNGQVKRDDIPSQEYLEAKEIQQEVDSMDTHPLFQTRPGDARDSIGYNKNLKGRKWPLDVQ